MKTYRVIKEMPFMKVGDKFSSTFNPSSYVYNFDYLVENGWIEEIVEKKSLEDKFLESDGFNAQKFHEIARQHFLELFDEARKECFSEKSRVRTFIPPYFNFIRSKLEKG